MTSILNWKIISNAISTKDFWKGNYKTLSQPAYVCASKLPQTNSGHVNPYLNANWNDQWIVIRIPNWLLCNNVHFVIGRQYLLFARWPYFYSYTVRWWWEALHDLLQFLSGRLHDEGFPNLTILFDRKKEVEILEGRPNWLRDWLDAPKFHKTLATGLHATIHYEKSKCGKMKQCNMSIKTDRTSYY